MNRHEEELPPEFAKIIEELLKINTGSYRVHSVYIVPREAPPLPDVDWNEELNNLPRRSEDERRNEPYE